MKTKHSLGYSNVRNLLWGWVRYVEANDNTKREPPTYAQWKFRRESLKKKRAKRRRRLRREMMDWK